MNDRTAAPYQAGAKSALGARFLAIGLMRATVMCFAALDASAKFPSRQLPTAEVAWAR